MERAIRCVFAERDAEAIDAIERAARPLRFADPWLREDVAAEYLGISPVTLSKLRRGADCELVPFDTRERHRKHWYRRTGPLIDGRGSLESYIIGDIGPAVS